jgi:hypothetical protein
MQTLADVVGHQRLDRTPLLQGTVFHLLHQVIREVKRGFHRASSPVNHFSGLLGSDARTNVPPAIPRRWACQPGHGESS